MTKCNCTPELDEAYRFGVKHETTCPRYHPPASISIAEFRSGVESAMQTARWSIPVDLAINAHADALAFDGAPFPDLEISGDHRPRLGRRRLDLDDVAAFNAERGLSSPRSPWAGRRDTDEHVIPCPLCGAEIRLAREAPDFDERRAAAIAEHVGLHAKRAR